ICGAFYTCTNKGECCPECEHFDPLDNLCMAGHLKKKTPKTRTRIEEDVDPETFLFDDDDEDLDDSDLPPERDVMDSPEDLEDDLDEWD
ncbi:MAG: hypothetical protein ACFE8Z_10590, partial [Candidatus Hermodarchaeota archaeon]